jgi:sulfur relay (sulfurtransferase) DsrF/TusC family protein
MELLSSWLSSPLLRTYDYSDDEIMQIIAQAPSEDGSYNLSSFRTGFRKLFAIANSECSREDVGICADAVVEQQQQQHPLVIDVGSSIGYFPFLSLSLGARV